MLIQHYLSIIKTSENSLKHLEENTELLRRFTMVHNLAHDLELLAQTVTGLPEERMFRLSLIEYQHMLCCTAFAQYRQAHMHLRIFFELALGSIHFSAHQIDTKLWLKGRKDTSWTSIASPDQGVLSKFFLDAFFEELKEYAEQYRAMAVSLYRECSEFVHGNVSSFEGFEGEFSLNDEALNMVLDRADTAVLVVKFAFLGRYLTNIDMGLRENLKDMVNSDFHGIPPLQEAFNEVQ